MDEQENYEASMEGEESVQDTTPTPTRVAPTVSAQTYQKPVTNAAPGKIAQLKIFIKECIRVFKITKKPDRKEFVTVVKISGAGILIIGALGFIIHIANQLIFK
jgi:protein transport protein SEC61 subunit gamma and related proteins